jgi:hypothetical protein
LRLRGSVTDAGDTYDFVAVQHVAQLQLGAQRVADHLELTR